MGAGWEGGCTARCHCLQRGDSGEERGAACGTAGHPAPPPRWRRERRGKLMSGVGGGVGGWSQLLLGCPGRVTRSRRAEKRFRADFRKNLTARSPESRNGRLGEIFHPEAASRGPRGLDLRRPGGGASASLVPSSLGTRGALRLPPPGLSRGGGWRGRGRC